MFDFVLLCITLCPFKLANHLEEEERACCLAFIILRMSCYCIISMLCGSSSWCRGLVFSM